MKIALFSKTPLAAAPWELFKALRKYTLHDVHLINAMHRYPDGRIFPFEFLLNGKDNRAREALEAAEIWHVNNYLVEDLRTIRNGRPVLAQFHSVPKLGNWAQLMAWATKSYTIRQPLQEKEYGLPTLPNIIDPDEYRPMRRPDRVAVAFAPSSKAPIGQACSKGYDEVKRILQAVAGKRDIEVILIEGMSYETNLLMKQRAHILIDDVVTGNFHRTSLEGACFGCAVLNRSRFSPFLNTSLATLEERLLWLIDNRPALTDIQEQTRAWVLDSWHPIDQVKEYISAYQALAGGAQKAAA